MKVELLYFEGCPNHRSTEQRLREIIMELGIEAEIELVKVEDHDDAISKRFLGSPSVRVNGNDLVTDEDETTQYSMRCRLYRSNGGISGVPTKDVIVAAIQAALDKKT